MLFHDGNKTNLIKSITLTFSKLL